MKRSNKNKEEILEQMQVATRVASQKELAKLIFPLLGTDKKTVYDAQTVLGAIAGYVKLEMLKKEEALLVSDVPFDLSKEPESAIKTAMLEIMKLIQGKKAKDVVDLFDLMASKLPQYLAGVHMKEPAEDIKVEDFIA